VKEVKNVRVNLEPLIRKKSIKLYNVPDKLAQKDIATATGIPQGTLSRWINGKVDSYKGDILSALMNYFECELTDLFDVEYAAPVADVADDGSKRRNVRSKS
jgi:transcriptional regulator with XRE-family HTH domain